MKPLKETLVSIVQDGKVIASHMEFLPDPNAPDIDDGTLTVEKLIALLSGLPDKSKKVWCSVEAGCVKEGVTGIDREDDEKVVLSTTGA